MALLTNHIESITPGDCGGKASIAGTRIRAQDRVAWHEMYGRSPDTAVSVAGDKGKRPPSIADCGRRDVETKGFEPSTFALRTRRSPN